MEQQNNKRFKEIDASFQDSIESLPKLEQHFKYTNPLIREELHSWRESFTIDQAKSQCRSTNSPKYSCAPVPQKSHGGRTTQNWHRLASGWHFFLPKMFFGLSMCFEQFQTFHFEKFPKIEIFVDWHRLASRLASAGITAGIGLGQTFLGKKKVFVTSFCSFALP